MLAIGEDHEGINQYQLNFGLDLLFLEEDEKEGTLTGYGYDELYEFNREGETETLFSLFEMKCRIEAGVLVLGAMGIWKGDEAESDEVNWFYEDTSELPKWPKTKCYIMNFQQGPLLFNCNDGTVVQAKESEKVLLGLGYRKEHLSCIYRFTERNQNIMIM